MSHTVPSLALYGFVLSPVVEEKVVEKSRPCARTCIEMQQAAEFEVIIGYVKAVLKARRSAVVAEFAQAQDVPVVYEILDAAEIIIALPEILF